MTETTPTTVATPMMTPSSVRTARSLWRVRADDETRKSSAVVMASRGLRTALLVAAFLLDDDPVAVLDRAEHLEGPRHDFLARLRPLGDFDEELAGDPRLDFAEGEL